MRNFLTVTSRYCHEDNYGEVDVASFATGQEVSKLITLTAAMRPATVVLTGGQWKVEATVNFERTGLWDCTSCCRGDNGRSGT